MGILCAIILNLTQAFAFDQTLALEDFLKMVQDKNLDLLIEGMSASAASSRATGPTIPAPMISAIKMNMQNGKSANGFEIAQMIPFPTKLVSEYRASHNQEKAAFEKNKATESEVLAYARKLFVDLWLAQERLNVLFERQKIIQDHVKLARSTTRSDSSATLHLLTAESELDLLENELNEAREELNERQIQLATFINVDSKNFHPVALAPKLSDIPTDILPTESTHQLLSTQWEVETLKARELQATSSWAPDFNLRYKQMGATSMFPRYHEIMVGITLPFANFWGPNSQSKGATADRMKKEYEFKRQKQNVDAEKNTLELRAHSLKEQIDLINNKLIPRAHKRMKVMNNLAPRDMQTLKAHLETMDALPELRMKSLDLRMKYEEAIAGLNKYLPLKGH